ncbi:MAG: AMP-binding protein [Rhodospirillales bacterium]|nr:AMP-binding protein [Rhodospirillales bacterium]MDE0380659.1 AMP-binding protein [Rhodospirillales bacterium]
MPETTDIHALLERGGRDDIAIAAPEREPLSYGALRDQVGRSGEALGRAGIGPGERVAIVLSNGPEMATAFLATAAHATAAPLNPAYRVDEFAFYLEDLRAKALILEAGLESPAVEAAERVGVPIIGLTPESAAGAGSFSLDVPTGAGDARGDGEGDDAALVLHTSGTTSRPKIVPLTGANLCASARNIAEWISLEPGDRCLNIMPLFHIHGLMAGVMASLHAGSTVICTPGFNALRVFAWLDAMAPTWLTAVPTMHQAILARAARNREIVARRRLRLLRSSSSSLPAPVMEELEAAFDAPVIESYGMTEASHQMTSNPMPPAERRPGGVGIAAGPEVAIMDEAGALQAPGAEGEVVIRGPNVTAGYENNPQANAAAFSDGWFRTGDQGVIDGAGYLTLTGRLKEIINRGGEKIAPREVDDVLMTHPAVAQAVAFAVPHQKLGEDVAAVIVLREGAEADERELRAFAAGSLADFKVPRTILFRDEIPKGATGKLQRIGLAEKLGIAT